MPLELKQPLNVSDISIQKATEVVPARLQQFLRWLLQSQRAFEGEGLSIDDAKDLDESVLKENETRNILAIVTVNNSRPTRIGFPPMIPAPVKEPNTV